MNEEDIKITLSTDWHDRFTAAALVVGRLADSLDRIATALNRLAEYERKKTL